MSDIAVGESHIWEKAVYGSVPGMAYFRMRGYNGAITTTFEPLTPQSGAYTLRTAAMSTPYVASADANDTSAGTGARTVQVRGVDTSFVAFAETLSMNGQTSVNLVTAAVLMINSIEVLTAGSGGSNAGIIRVGTGTNTAGVPAVVEAHVPIGLNITTAAMYCTAAGVTMLMRNLVMDSYGVTAAQTVQFVLDRYVNTGILKREYIGHLNQAGSSGLVMPNLIIVAPKTQVIIQALSAASTGPVSFSAECMLLTDAWATSAQTLF